MYSETGNYTQAISTAQQALDLADQAQNTTLAESLRANLTRYQHQSEEAAPNR